MLTLQAGGILGYTTDDETQRSNYQDLLLMSYGTVYLGGGSHDGELNINDTGKKTRWKIDTDYIRGNNSSGDTQFLIQNDGSMWWYDASGNQIATMQSGYLWLSGITGSVSTNIDNLAKRATALEKSDTWTSTAWRGLTCNAYREGKAIMITLRGTTTSVLDMASGYLPICTLPVGFRPVATHTQYCIYGAEWKGQLVLNVDGTVRLGYSRRLTATANEDIPTGTNIYITATFVTGDD
jgi:hypothetical protein